MADGLRKRVLLVGATGTIGRATAHALVAAGHEAVCLARTKPEPEAPKFKGAEVRVCDVADPVSLAQDGFGGAPFDAVISCLASRTGAPKDAWAIDHQANLNVLGAAKEAGVGQFVLLSAICVQKPELAFQQAKLAFEKALTTSGLTYSIVRPTAFFKSLSGQIRRVQNGKPFLMFGDGALTACKPISDADLGQFLVNCLGNEAAKNEVLPIGGPGPAMTPREQGMLLFDAAGKPPKFKSVPVGFLSAIIAVLSFLGTVVPKLKEKAEFAKIGRYYATQSMLVWDAQEGRYDADATPEFGADTLAEHYGKLARGDIADDRGEHAVF